MAKRSARLKLPLKEWAQDEEIKETLSAYLGLPPATSEPAKWFRSQIRDVAAGVLARLASERFDYYTEPRRSRLLYDTARLKEMYMSVCSLIDKIDDIDHRNALYMEFAFLLFAFGEVKPSDMLDFNTLVHNDLKAKTAQRGKSTKAATKAEAFRSQIEALDRQHPNWPAGRIGSTAWKNIPDSPDKPAEITLKRYACRLLGRR